MVQIESVFLWLITGLVAGFLAGRLMRSSYGLLGDFVLGIIGAFVGGFLANLVGLSSFNLIGSIIIAFGGACLCIWLLRFIAGATTRSGGRRRR